MKRGAQYNSFDKMKSFESVTQFASSRRNKYEKNEPAKDGKEGLFEGFSSLQNDETLSFYT